MVCLDEVVGHKGVIGDPMVATMEDQADDEAPTSVKTRKQKKAGSRMTKAKTLVEEIADAATVNLSDTSHRDKGWWAIDTGNPNAWGGDCGTPGNIVGRRHGGPGN